MPHAVCNLFQHLKLVMHSIIWAFRHTERYIAESGLNPLLEMLKKFQVWSLYIILFITLTVDLQSFFASFSCFLLCIAFPVLEDFWSSLKFSLIKSLCNIKQESEFCNQFYRTYFLTIEQEIFAVLTDTFHKPGFKFHVLVLQHLFCLVQFQNHAFICFIIQWEIAVMRSLRFFRQKLVP